MHYIHMSNILLFAQNIQENETSFTDTDVSIIEAFAIFCGLGIHNTQMYENACKLMAKQKVALECLSYHATATQEQTIKLVQDTIQPAEDYSLYSFKFIGRRRLCCSHTILVRILNLYLFFFFAFFSFIICARV